MNARKIFVSQQSENDCGCASLAMVCKYYHYNVTLNKVKKDSNLEKLLGMTLGDLSRVARNYGFDTVAVRLNDNSLSEKFTLPAIVRTFLENGKSHYMVLLKVKGEKVILLDPTIGVLSMKRTDFWKQSDGSTLLLCPGERFVQVCQKSTEVSKAIKKELLAEIIENRKLLIFAVLISLLISAVGLLSSFIYQVVIDQIVSETQPELLISVLWFFGTICIIQVAISLVENLLSLKLDKKINIPTIKRYFQHLMNLSLPFHENAAVGDILVRSQDAIAMKSFAVKCISDIAVNGPIIIGASVILWRISWLLFIFVSIMTCLVLIVSFLMKDGYAELNRKEKMESSLYNSMLVDSFTNISAVKYRRMEEYYTEKITTSFQSLVDAGVKKSKFIFFETSLTELLLSIGRVLLLGVEAWLVLSKVMSTGQMMTVITLAGLIMNSSNTLLSLVLSKEEYKVSLSRLSEFYDEPEEGSRDGRNLLKTIDRIELSSVSFQYRQNSELLNGITLSIQKKQKIAFVGESGCGKTTLAKIIASYYQPSRGTMLYNSQSFEEISRADLRNRICIVQQTPQMMSGTVFNHVIEGEKNPAMIGKVQEYLNAFQGEKLLLKGDAALLSKGEQQKIEIARALATDADLYIMDEPTSGVDCFAEKVIISRIFDVLSEKMLIMIAHKLSTVCQCDIIYYLEDGKIAEKGTHPELMKKKGKYYRMWCAQNNMSEEIG